MLFYVVYVKTCGAVWAKEIGYLVRHAPRQCPSQNTKTIPQPTLPRSLTRKPSVICLQRCRKITFRTLSTLLPVTTSRGVYDWATYLDYETVTSYFDLNGYHVYVRLTRYFYNDSSLCKLVIKLPDVLKSSLSNHVPRIYYWTSVNACAIAMLLQLDVFNSYGFSFWIQLLYNSAR